MFTGFKMKDLQDGARPPRVAIRSQCVRTNTEGLPRQLRKKPNRPAAKRRKKAAHRFPRSEVEGA